MPKDNHSVVQGELCHLFGEVRQKKNLHFRPELHVRVAETRIRVVDLAVFAPDRPNAPIPSDPPLIAIEILSLGEKFHEVVDKLRDYSHWGVLHIWVIDPASKDLFVWDGRSITSVDSYFVPEFDLTLNSDRIFPVGELSD